MLSDNYKINRVQTLLAKAILIVVISLTGCGDMQDEAAAPTLTMNSQLKRQVISNENEFQCSDFNCDAYEETTVNTCDPVACTGSCFKEVDDGNGGGGLL